MIDTFFRNGLRPSIARKRCHSATAEIGGSSPRVLRLESDASCMRELLTRLKTNSAFVRREKARVTAMSHWGDGRCHTAATIIGVNWQWTGRVAVRRRLKNDGGSREPVLGNARPPGPACCAVRNVPRRSACALCRAASDAAHDGEPRADWL